MKLIQPYTFRNLVFFLIIILGCQKSTHEKTVDNEPGINPKEYITATVSGRITDNNHMPVNGVMVKVASFITTTDINGYFRVNNASLDKNVGVVIAEKDGFFQGSRTIIVNSGTTNYVSIQLIKKEVSGTVSGVSGGNITVLRGGSISFTANSFFNPVSNSTYTGSVKVSSYFINPAAPDFNDIMPGTLRGISTANEEVGLQSFGMMAVELTGAGGEKLQLAHDKTATITFPIPSALQAQAPSTIPLWSFNDTTGLWKQEGTATRQGNNYIGIVSHFSYWNCDFPYSLIDFKAVIKDQNGKAIYPAKVIIKTIDDTLSSYGFGYTDSTGLITGKIPSGKILQFNVFNSCGTSLYSQQVGPFNANTDLGTITLNYAGTDQITITGSVINCNGTAVTNGYVQVILDNKNNLAPVANGLFSITINRCNNTPANALIIAYDLNNNQNGPDTSIQVTTGTLATGSLRACGLSSPEYVRFSLNNVNYSFIPPADTLMLYGWSIHTYSLSAARRNKSNDSDEAILTFNDSIGIQPEALIYIRVNNMSWARQSLINLNLTEFGAIGSYVSGNFSAILKDSLGMNMAPVNFKFRVKNTRY